MIIIKPECRENAIGMLQNHRAIARTGSVLWFVVDGKTWAWMLDGIVARCDNPEESEDLRKAVTLIDRAIMELQP